METTVKRFESANEDTLGQTTWTNEDETVFSGALDVNDFNFNYETGFVDEQRKIAWIKAKSQAMLDFMLDFQMKAVVKGDVKAFREFSNEPFYPEQTHDINPTTGENIVGEAGGLRYSQVRLCPASQFEAKNRAYVVPIAGASAVVVTEDVTVGAFPTP